MLFQSSSLPILDAIFELSQIRNDMAVSQEMHGISDKKEVLIWRNYF